MSNRIRAITLAALICGVAAVPATAQRMGLETEPSGLEQRMGLEMDPNG